MLRNFIILAVVIVVGYFVSETFVRKRAIDASLAGDLQRLIDGNITGNTLSVSAVIVPISIAAPFYEEAARNGVVPAKVEGMFSAKLKTGGANDQCDFATYAYEVRLVDGLTIAIAPEEVLKLQACQ